MQSDEQGVTTAARDWNEFWILFCQNLYNLYNYYLFDSFISCLTNLFSFLGEISIGGGGGGAVPTS
jgi:hypothetical protein